MKRQHLITLFLIGVGTLALVGFAAFGQTADDELVIGGAAGISTLDPHNETTTSIVNITRNIFETLTSRNENEELIPWLATSWEMIGETTWRFYLREDVTFHNGEPFDAEDVYYSITRLVDPAEALMAAWFIWTVESAEVISPYVVDLHTFDPDPILPAALSQAGYIVPSETVAQLGWEEFLKNPLGTGPFMFNEWVRDQQLVLDRYDDYWGGPATMRRLVYKPVPEVATRIAALKAGEIDIAQSIPVDSVAEIESDENLRVESVANVRNVFVILNKNVPPFDNTLVRQAMNYAVDVDALVQFLFSGRANRTPTIGSPAWLGYDETQAPYTYDPGKARELLAQAGYPNGFETTLAFAQGNPTGAEEITQAIATYLNDVGITVKFQMYEWGEYIGVWLDAKLPMYYMSLGTSTLDMDDFSAGYFDPDRRHHWGLPRDDAIDIASVASQTLDPGIRDSLYHGFLALLKEDAPFIFLFNFEQLYGVSERVKNFIMMPDELDIMTRVVKE